MKRPIVPLNATEILFPIEQFRRLERVAERLGKTPEEIVELAVETYLENLSDSVQSPSVPGVGADKIPKLFQPPTQPLDLEASANATLALLELLVVRRVFPPDADEDVKDVGVQNRHVGLLKLFDFVQSSLNSAVEDAYKERREAQMPPATARAA